MGHGLSKSVSAKNIINIEGLGDVVVSVRLTAKRFVARWKDGRVQLTVPYGATAADLRRAIAEMTPRIAAARPKDARFEFGRDYVYELLSFRIVGVSAYGGKCTVHEVGYRRFELRLDETVALDSPETMEIVSRQLKNLAKYVGRKVLPMEAEIVSNSVGVKPAKWQLASGSKVLGRCNGKRVITLSVMLVFLPEELRRYVICHELAHLTEMNHSERFHALCDLYCCGREREYRLSLKRFRFPC